MFLEYIFNNNLDHLFRYQFIYQKMVQHTIISIVDDLEEDIKTNVGYELKYTSLRTNSIIVRALGMIVKIIINSKFLLKLMFFLEDMEKVGLRSSEKPTNAFITLVPLLLHHIRYLVETIGSFTVLCLSIGISFFIFMISKLIYILTIVFYLVTSIQFNKNIVSINNDVTLFLDILPPEDVPGPISVPSAFQAMILAHTHESVALEQSFNLKTGAQLVHHTRRHLYQYCLLDPGKYCLPRISKALTLQRRTWLFKSLPRETEIPSLCVEGTSAKLIKNPQAIVLSTSLTTLFSLIMKVFCHVFGNILGRKHSVARSEIPQLRCFPLLCSNRLSNFCQRDHASWQIIYPQSCGHWTPENHPGPSNSNSMAPLATRLKTLTGDRCEHGALRLCHLGNWFDDTTVLVLLHAGSTSSHWSHFGWRWIQSSQQACDVDNFSFNKYIHLHTNYLSQKSFARNCCCGVRGKRIHNNSSLNSHGSTNNPNICLSRIKAQDNYNIWIDKKCQAIHLNSHALPCSARPFRSFFSINTQCKEVPGQYPQFPNTSWNCQAIHSYCNESSCVMFWGGEKYISFYNSPHLPLSLHQKSFANPPKLEDGNHQILLVALIFHQDFYLVLHTTYFIHFHNVFSPSVENLVPLLFCSSSCQSLPSHTVWFLILKAMCNHTKFCSSQDTNSIRTCLSAGLYMQEFLFWIQLHRILGLQPLHLTEMLDCLQGS
ncbi:hypothetical protein VP01_540g1 [Puccinia sorghi]|uniref:Uncharacterized protein n=1 Tax=Puccinia sorghi TaxID=27349 RepID=A0A0L6UJU6_9BASI|nr:hypothetical protein VP01_540g1 [Puccinia sorghi]